MWELDHKEDRVPKDWCFWTVVLKTLESSLDCKEIKPVNPKGNQSWIFIGRTEAEAQTPILWPPDAKTWFTGKDSDAGEDWGQQEKGTTGQDCWMVLSTQWTGVWVSSRSWWWTGRSGMLQSMGSQRVGRDWVTELNWGDWLKEKALPRLCSRIICLPLLPMETNYSCVSFRRKLQRVKSKDCFEPTRPKMAEDLTS